jgi:hypothetical protein
MLVELLVCPPAVPPAPPVPPVLAFDPPLFPDDPYGFDELPVFVWPVLPPPPVFVCPVFPPLEPPPRLLFDGGGAECWGGGAEPPPPPWLS